jgi:hypothetical protein
MKKLLMLGVLAVSVLAVGQELKPVVTDLQSVRTVYVAGNNVSANYARKTLAQGKRLCLALAPKPDDADATLTVDAVQSVGTGLFGPHQTNVQTSATLTLRDGSIVWSDAVGGGALNLDGKFGGQNIVWKLNKSICGKR